MAENILVILISPEDIKSFRLGELEETTRTPSYNRDDDYPAWLQIRKPLPEWSSWRSSESSTLQTDVDVLRYALLVVHARKKERKRTTTSHKQQLNIQQMRILIMYTVSCSFCYIINWFISKQLQN